MTDEQSDTDRRRRTKEVNDRAQQAIADARNLVRQMNTSLDSLEGLVTLNKGAHHAPK